MLTIVLCFTFVVRVCVWVLKDAVDRPLARNFSHMNGPECSLQLSFNRRQLATKRKFKPCKIDFITNNTANVRNTCLYLFIVLLSLFRDMRQGDSSGRYSGSLTEDKMK